MRKVGRLAERMIYKILPEAALRPPPLQPIKYPCNAEYRGNFLIGALLYRID